MKREIERKMVEIIDWNVVKLHANEIEAYLGKMQRHKLGYIDDILWELKSLKEIFREAEDMARDELLKEDDAELEEEAELTIVKR